MNSKETPGPSVRAPVELAEVCDTCSCHSLASSVQQACSSSWFGGEWERWCHPPLTITWLIKPNSQSTNSHTRQLHRYIHCKTKKIFPLNLKNFNQLHPNSKIGRSVYTKKKSFRLERRFFFQPHPPPTHHHNISWNRPRNPVMSEGRFWRQIFQALRTGLNQFVHLASGGGELRSSPRGKKGLKYFGEMVPRVFRFILMVHVRCG